MGVGDVAVAAPVVSYAVTEGAFRVSEAIPANTPTVSGGTPDGFTVNPPLPAGVTLDPATGIISGTPTSESTMTNHTVTASNAGGASDATVAIAVGPPLPPAVESLADGFAAEVVTDGLPGNPKAAKIALAPDGRIFFIEVDTGNVRIIDASGALLATPFVTLQVLGGGHQGLLGLALDPAFATNGFVYVQACVPGDGRPPWTARRSTASPTRATWARARPSSWTTCRSPCRGPAASTAAASWSSMARAPCSSASATARSLATHSWTDSRVSGARSCATSRRARSRRTIPSAGVPSGVVACATRSAWRCTRRRAASSAWTTGTRATTSSTSCRWAGTSSGVACPPRTSASSCATTWTSSCQTGIDWHDGTGWGSDYADNLFMTSYDDLVIRRFEMSGSQYADIDREREWARLTEVGIENKPLDIAVSPIDGSIYVSTFSGIYRFFKIN